MLRHTSLRACRLLAAWVYSVLLILDCGGGHDRSPRAVEASSRQPEAPPVDVELERLRSPEADRILLVTRGAEDIGAIDIYDDACPAVAREMVGVYYPEKSVVVEYNNGFCVKLGTGSGTTSHTHVVGNGWGVAGRGEVAMYPAQGPEDNYCLDGLLVQLSSGATQPLIGVVDDLSVFAELRQGDVLSVKMVDKHQWFRKTAAGRFPPARAQGSLVSKIDAVEQVRATPRTEGTVLHPRAEDWLARRLHVLNQMDEYPVGQIAEAWEQAFEMSRRLWAEEDANREESPQPGSGGEASASGRSAGKADGREHRRACEFTVGQWAVAGDLEYLVPRTAILDSVVFAHQSPHRYLVVKGVAVRNRGRHTLQLSRMTEEGLYRPALVLSDGYQRAFGPRFHEITSCIGLEDLLRKHGVGHDDIVVAGRELVQGGTVSATLVYFVSRERYVAELERGVDFVTEVVKVTPDGNTKSFWPEGKTFIRGARVVR